MKREEFKGVLPEKKMEQAWLLTVGHLYICMPILHAWFTHCILSGEFDDEEKLSRISQTNYHMDLLDKALRDHLKIL